MRLATPSRMIALLGAAVLTLGVSACSPDAGTASAEGGSGAASHDATDPTMDRYEPAAELLPERIAEAGVLRAAIPTNEPPTQFYREGTKEMTGINPDIARLVAGALGLELQIEVANFDSIIPGIEADRYDLTVSSMTPTEERMQVLDFVEYLAMGDGLVVQSGNPQQLGFDQLCGKKVGVLTGSYQLTVNVPVLNDACTAAGSDPLSIQQFQDTAQAMGSLTSGRSDAVYADGPILAYAATQNPGIEVVGERDLAPVGIGIGRGTGLLDAVKAAMDHILTTDEYRAVLESYGVGSMAITEANVNVPQ
ncbi:MAG: transporter substrate-binding domain-containing protein [Leucobacter sp.]|nr:transporter substrate-binding domain-containing protein [Leucobacter sp.]